MYIFIKQWWEKMTLHLSVFFFYLKKNKYIQLSFDYFIWSSYDQSVNNALG